MPRRRRTKLAITLLAAIGAGACLLARFMHSTSPSADLNQELQRILSELARKDRSVKNCVLSVMTGDASFAWSGAAGIAHEYGQVPMTSDAPIYIASITKLYTATAVMLLNEKGALSLDDPMAKYLPNELIRGTGDRRLSGRPLRRTSSTQTGTSPRLAPTEGIGLMEGLSPLLKK